MAEEIIPKTKEFREQGKSWLEKANSVKITVSGEYLRAGEMLREVVALKKSIQDAFADSKKKAFDAHKAIVKLEADLLKEPSDAERLLRIGIAKYLDEDRRRQQAELDKATAEIQKKEEKRREAEVERLAESGNVQAAEIVRTAPMHVPKVEAVPPKAEGIQIKKKWNFRIVNPEAIARSFMVPDLIAIRKTVQTMGDRAPGIVGGIEVFEETGLAVK